MVAPAFGFGAGDFVAAINFLRKATKALQEISGASNQFQQAVLELDNLTGVLARMQALKPNSTNRDIIENVQFLGRLCHIPVITFANKIKKFEKRLGLDIQSSTGINVFRQVSGAGRKIQWALSLETELSALKARIGPQLATIALLLQLEFIEQTNDTSSAVNSLREKVTLLLASVDGLKETNILVTPHRVDDLTSSPFSQLIMEKQWKPQEWPKHLARCHERATEFNWDKHVLSQPIDSKHPRPRLMGPKRHVRGRTFFCGFPACAHATWRKDKVHNHLLEQHGVTSNFREFSNPSSNEIIQIPTQAEQFRDKTTLSKDCDLSALDPSPDAEAQGSAAVVSGGFS